MIRLAAWALALLAAIAAPATAGARGQAGYVTALDIPDGAPAPVLRRQGEALDVQVWTELFDGDALEVAGAAKVTIETAKDKRLVVDAARSPHRIAGELGGGGRFAALAATLGDLFRGKPETQATNLVGRNDAAPRLRIGQTPERQIVVAGKPVWAAWQGGAAPFTVEIRGQSRMRRLDIRVLGSQTTEARDAKIVIPGHAAGHLTLIIRDASGLEAQAWLQAQSTLPQTPDWIARGAPTPEMAKLATAVHWLGRDPHVYDFLAAGVAAELDTPPARHLLDMIARGSELK